MSTLFNDALAFLGSQGGLVLPLILAVWIAWGDVRTHRIPNYLTLGTALAGLAYNLALHGWSGLADGALGLCLGFAFLILPYIWGGMGAGDVKALAALGAWVGGGRILMLFCYMGIAGGLFALGVLWWRGEIRLMARRAWVRLANWVLSRPAGATSTSASAPKTPGIPYGVAMAVGMVGLLITR